MFDEDWNARFPKVVRSAERVRRSGTGPQAAQCRTLPVRTLGPPLPSVPAQAPGALSSRGGTRCGAAGRAGRSRVQVKAILGLAHASDDFDHTEMDKYGVGRRRTVTPSKPSPKPSTPSMAPLRIDGCAQLVPLTRG